MDFLKLVSGRESVRSYDSSRPVPKDVLIRILEAGRMAPSAMNYQPWQFILVSGPDMLQKVKACYPREWFQSVPHILIVKGFRDQAWVRRSDKYNSIETDLTIAMTHMILSAENEGLATCWIEAFDAKNLYKFLGLKRNEVIFGMAALGYPVPGFQKECQKERKSLDEVVIWL